MRKFNTIQSILSRVRKAVEEYKMIEDGDRIAVGVSGGKDSLTLLCALAHLRLFLGKKFDIIAVTIDMGFDGADFSEIELLCNQLDVKYHIVPTQIYKIIFDIRQEKSPCSLCSKMRRGALHDAAKELECNKIALGHHLDDVVETFMLNLFFEGRIGCFRPVTYLSIKDLTMIRPLIYTYENEIASFATKEDLPVYKSPCPADGFTERAKINDFLHSYEIDHPGLYHRIIGAIKRAEVDGFHIDMISQAEKKLRKKSTSEEE